MDELDVSMSAAMDSVFGKSGKEAGDVYKHEPAHVSNLSDTATEDEAFNENPEDPLHLTNIGDHVEIFLPIDDMYYPGHVSTLTQKGWQVCHQV